jgi:hypothetical protein
MSAPSAIWSSHLQPDEHLVWSATASDALLRAARRRAQGILLATGAAAALLSLLLAARFFESVSAYATQDIAASLLVPLYAVFALAMAALAWGSFSRLAAKPRTPIYFAATNLRLISLTPDGAIADELAAADIDNVVAGGRVARPDIYVLRRDDPQERRAFSIEHIERPMEAKAIIEETFLESAHEQAD